MSNRPGTTCEPIPPGTLDMLVLQTLEARGRQHGFEIANSILVQSESVLKVEEGSLYPALQRLLIQGLVNAEWNKTEDNRRARYYRITLAGRKQLARKVFQYRRVSGAICKVLQPA